MNNLPGIDERTWRLPEHAHVVVHRADGGDDGGGGDLVTIYDCGAAQKPPSAQVIGSFVRCEADHERLYQPTGYILKLREPSVLERQAERRWVVRRSPRTDG